MAKKARTSKASGGARTSKAHGKRKSGTSKGAKTPAASRSGRSKATGARKTGKTVTKKTAKKVAKKKTAKKAAKKTSKKSVAKKAVRKTTKKRVAKKATKKVAAAPKGRAKTSKNTASRTPVRKKAGGTKSGKRTVSKNARTATRKGKGAGKASEHIYIDHSSEDLFASQLLEELEFRHSVDVATLDLRIRDGQAVARGSVSDHEELEAVRETIEDAGSVTDVTFVVQVAPDRREADRDRARQIQEVIESTPDLADENILVACVGKKVVVRGTVDKLLKKHKAGLLALRSGDAARVSNRLVVVSEA